MLRKIRSDFLGIGRLLEQGRNNFATNGEVIIRNLGDLPLRLCLSAEENCLVTCR